MIYPYVDFQIPWRSGKQCRERWHNHLDPNINKDTWTDEEGINNSIVFNLQLNHITLIFFIMQNVLCQKRIKN